jgi:hypothetical protein
MPVSPPFRLDGKQPGFSSTEQRQYDEHSEAGSGIRELARLRKRYGRGRWRKRKGCAEVRLSDGTIIRAELHWYEATGIGKREFKIKRFL